MKPATPVQLDHVHVGVRNRRRAAAWQLRVLRLRVTYDYTDHGDPHGPLVLSGDGNHTHVALFVAADAAKRRRTHIGTLGFPVPGPVFLSFVRRLAHLELRNVEGQRVAPCDASTTATATRSTLPTSTTTLWKSLPTITTPSNAP